MIEHADFARQHGPLVRSTLSTPNSPLTLSSLNKLPGQYRVIHGVGVPGYKAMVSHLVVGPSGVFAIDLIHRGGRMKVSRAVFRLGNHDLGKDCAFALWEAGLIGEVLQHAVTPVLCLTGATLPDPIIHRGHVVACSAEALVSHIEGGPHCLDDDAVAFFADRASTLVRDLRSAPTAAVMPADEALGQSPTVETRRPDPRVGSLRSLLRRRGPARRLVSIACGGLAFALSLQIVSSATDLIENRREGVAEAPSPIPSSPRPYSPADLDRTRRSSISPAAPESASTAESTIESTLAVTPFALPTISFGCPVQGAGWTASPVATEFEVDPEGYHLWYQLPGADWTYWGQFKSGLAAPPAVGPIQPGELLNVRLDRNLQPSAEAAANALTIAAPTGTC